jgi:hypothetical protein
MLTEETSSKKLPRAKSCQLFCSQNKPKHETPRVIVQKYPLYIFIACWLLEIFPVISSETASSDDQKLGQDL